MATLTGNLGNDAEQRYSASGTALLRFNVASNYRERVPSGEYEDRVEWVRVTITGDRAEKLAQYLTKGTRVTVVGRLTARPWTDNQGGLRAGLEMMVSEIDFSTPRDGTQQERPSGQPAKPRQTAASGAGQGSGDLPW